MTTQITSFAREVRAAVGRSLEEHGNFHQVPLGGTGSYPRLDEVERWNGNFQRCVPNERQSGSVKGRHQHLANRKLVAEIRIEAPQ
jgi:hypothetical protein